MHSGLPVCTRCFNSSSAVAFDFSTKAETREQYTGGRKTPASACLNLPGAELKGFCTSFWRSSLASRGRTSAEGHGLFCFRNEVDEKAGATATRRYRPQPISVTPAAFWRPPFPSLKNSAAHFSMLFLVPRAQPYRCVSRGTPCVPPGGTSFSGAVSSGICCPLTPRHM